MRAESGLAMSMAPRGSVPVGGPELEVRVGLDDGAEVARGVDLGDDGDVPLGGDLEQAAHLVLGEVVVRDDLGVALGLDAERLVVGEVERELVVLEVAQLAYPVLDPVDRVGLAGDVQHEAALRLGGRVLDHALGRARPGAQRLLEGAGAVEDTGLVGRGDQDLPVGDAQLVRLGAAGGVALHVEADVAALRLGLAAVVDVQLAGEQPALVGQLPVGDDDSAALPRLPPGPARRLVLTHRGDGRGLLRHRVRGGVADRRLGGAAVRGGPVGGPVLVRPERDGQRGAPGDDHRGDACQVPGPPARGLAVAARPGRGRAPTGRVGAVGVLRFARAVGVHGGSVGRGGWGKGSAGPGSGAGPSG